MPRGFFLNGAALIVGVALWTGLAPLQASVWTVFLFAGPHNWMEARYFLARMPVRWLQARAFFLTGIGGALLLAASQAALHWAPEWLPLWNVALCGWAGSLAALRARELKRDCFLALPATLAAAGLAVSLPSLFALALVYLHPLAALWFLGRQIRLSRPEWLRHWRVLLMLVPACGLVLASCLNKAPHLGAANEVAFAIVRHAGAGLLTNLSSHLLVSVHVYLEILHYAVWIFALPMIGLGAKPWTYGTIPLLRHRLGWPRLVRTILLAGAAAALLLWACFLLDYAATRQVYFMVAVIHVLAEIPFLIRLR
jgi:hypothetical protein